MDATVNSDDKSALDVAAALRVALAAAVTLVLAEWWHLAHANLAVWTSYMVMVSVPFTSFQKGIERVVGRGLGVLAGLVIHALFPDRPLIQVILEAALIALAFYIYFAGRLAYTALNAGLYIAAILEVAHADPDGALPYGKEVLLAVALGVIVADVVNWLTGAEHDLTITAGTAPLLPVNFDWLNRSLLLMVTAIVTQMASRWLDLPATQAVISVMVLTVSPDIQSLILKGELRLLGAFLGSGWSFASFVLLAQADHFTLLVALVFVGIFLAAYLSRVGGRYAYAGVQMGLVLPLVIVVDPSEFGSLHSSWQRLEGVLIALALSTVIAALWPRFKFSADM
jgi:uncharacterized membrane protein YgaE (UPF0421/DUF939 family)